MGMNEQTFFEGDRCPVEQKFESRRDRKARKQAEQQRSNQELDRLAQEAAWQSRYEQGFTSF